MERPLTPLSAEFLRALEGREDLLVSSRDQRGVGTVRVWFAVGPPGVVYLFTFANSLKAQRWRADPWAMLRIPGTDIANEGVAHFVEGEELADVAPLIVDRWDMAGATTIPGLMQLVESGMHSVVRIEGTPRTPM